MQYEDEVGSARFEQPAPGLVLTTARGRARAPMVESYLREVAHLCNTTTVRVRVYHDWYGLEGYDSEARVRFLERSEERRRLIREVFEEMHVLVSSNLVYAALEAARVLYDRTLHVYRRRAPFDAALEASKRAPPSTPYVRASSRA